MNARVSLQPENRAAWLGYRALDVTSTEAAALFPTVGSPYCTAFELWHRKRDAVVVELDSNERMDWGNDLQDSIALALGRRYGVQVGRITEYTRIPEARMGASFDFEVLGLATPHYVDPAGRFVGDPILRDMVKQHGPGILEIKNVDRAIFADKWIKRLSDDERATGAKPPIEPPGHIDIQLQHQLHVRGNAWGAIGVLVGGNTGRLLVRERMEDVGQAIENRVREFWRSVDAGTPPSPAFPDDAQFVASLYRTSSDRVFDGRGNIELDQHMRDYCAAAEREKLAKEDKDVAKAKALMIIGDAERAYTDGFQISAKEVATCHIEAFDRKGYRGWRVTAKKAKP